MGEALNYKDLLVVQRAVELVQAVHVFVVASKPAQIVARSTRSVCR